MKVLPLEIRNGLSFKNIYITRETNNKNPNYSITATYEVMFLGCVTAHHKLYQAAYDNTIRHALPLETGVKIRKYNQSQN